MSSQSTIFSLRNVLFVDAATCALTGLAMSTLAAPLALLLAIPVGLLFYAGLALLPIAALMVFVGTRAAPSAPLVWLLIVGNVVWALASFALVVPGPIAPNALGVAFIVFQALVVLALTALEIRASGELTANANMRSALRA